MRKATQEETQKLREECQILREHIARIEGLRDGEHRKRQVLISVFMPIVAVLFSAVVIGVGFLAIEARVGSRVEQEVKTEVGEFTKRFDAIETAAAQAIEAADRAETAAQRAESAYGPLVWGWSIQRNWVVVIFTSDTLENARDAAKVAAAKTYDTNIVKKDTFYYVIILKRFATQKDAENAIAEMPTEISSSAMVMDLTTECPRMVLQEGFYECVGVEYVPYFTLPPSP
jgi:hypothetical protein